MNPAVWLTPGQLADRSGVAVSALHYYESRGLITSRRTSGNQRRYRRDTLRKVAFIKVAQGVGVSLDEIKERSIRCRTVVCRRRRTGRGCRGRGTTG